MILAISGNTKNDLIQLYNVSPEKIEVVYLAASINKRMALPKEKLNLTERYLLYVGNRDFYKNFNNFLLAIEPLLKDNPELFLIAAGGGKFNASELKLFEIKNLKNKILYKPADDTSLATLYKNALAFVFPSLYEGFGIPALEAMNCDCPVVMSNTSSLPEVGGEAAIYFNPTKQDDIREKIASVIFNEELREDLIKKAAVQRNNFSFKRTALKTKEAYEKLLNK
jgi:glycosyltransferase involved in cell wall biosynthesis